MAEDERQRPDEERPEGADGAEEPAPRTAGEPGPEVEGAEEVAAAAEQQQPETAEAPGPETAEAPGPEAAEAPGAEAAEERERPRRPRRGRRAERDAEEEVIPGEHLEPDLVLEDQQLAEEDEFAALAEAEAAVEEPEEEAEPEPAREPEPRPVVREPLDLAADARYRATGKRKSAVARVILKPGDGTYSVNGRALDQAFPRIKLQRTARQPLETAGYAGRMDVVAKIHGGGVSSQAAALRHGIARALVEADPGLRLELKRRGFLTRDPRVKERKKAGLKKARKRPQFSKR
jgi:small subunit ribosomal protein S9